MRTPPPRRHGATRSTRGARDVLVRSGPVPHLSPRLRIEVVSSADRLGDPETTLLALLDSAGDRLTPSLVAFGESALREPASERGWPITRLGTSRRTAGTVRGVWPLRTRWRREPPDVVLVTDARAATAAIPAACLAPARVVWMQHEPARRTAIGRFLARLADGILVTGPATASAGARTVVLPPSVARTVSDPSSASALAARTARFVGALSATAARPGAGAASGPPVSVVVPLHNELLAVDDIVAAVETQLRPDDELVLVDDGSTDGTPERLEAARARGHVTILMTTNAGAAAARNRGVHAARHDVIACTDAGCEPTPGWLDSLRASFTEVPAPALVNGVYRVRTDTWFQRAAEVACYPDVSEARRSGIVTRIYGRFLGRRFEAHTPNGRSLAFSRAAWHAVGGFPEDLRTAEDVRFGTQVIEAGLPALLSADAEVAWTQRPTLRATARMYYRYGLGDAAAGDTRMIVRNLVRAAGYVCAPALVVFGGWAGTAAVALGAAVYLWLPIARVRRRRLSPAIVAAIPIALAVKDGAKAVGCIHGLIGARP